MVANLHQVTERLPSLEYGLVSEGINEPPNAHGCNQ
jgi:hypothetical protein